MRTFRSARTGFMSWGGLLLTLLTAATLIGCSSSGDAQTPQSVPSSEDGKKAAREIAPMLDRSKVTVQVEEGGESGSANLNGGFQSVMLARVNADGTVSHACVETEDEAAAFFSALNIQLPLPRKK